MDTLARGSSALILRKQEQGMTAELTTFDYGQTDATSVDYLRNRIKERNMRKIAGKMFTRLVAS